MRGVKNNFLVVGVVLLLCLMPVVSAGLFDWFKWTGNPIVSIEDRAQKQITIIDGVLGVDECLEYTNKIKGIKEEILITVELLRMGELEDLVNIIEKKCKLKIFKSQGYIHSENDLSRLDLSFFNLNGLDLSDYSPELDNLILESENIKTVGQLNSYSIKWSKYEFVPGLDELINNPQYSDYKELLIEIKNEFYSQKMLAICSFDDWAESIIDKYKIIIIINSLLESGRYLDDNEIFDLKKTRDALISLDVLDLKFQDFEKVEFKIIDGFNDNRDIETIEDLKKELNKEKMSAESRGCASVYEPMEDYMFYVKKGIIEGHKKSVISSNLDNINSNKSERFKILLNNTNKSINSYIKSVNSSHRVWKLYDENRTLSLMEKLSNLKFGLLQCKTVGCLDSKLNEILKLIKKINKEIEIFSTTNKSTYNKDNKSTIVNVNSSTSGGVN